jgi:hypothetical protein
VRRQRAWSGAGVLLLGLSLALAPVTVASATKHKTKHPAKHSKHKGKSTHGATTTTTTGTSNVGSLNCPKESVISAATGTTYTGPNATNGGTAACIYLDAAGDDLNVVNDSPNETLAEFISTDPSDIGEPAQAVSGLGKAAFDTTTYGHAEVDVYESSSKGFGVTLDPANQATVTTADLTQVLAVAHAIATG